MSEVTAVLRRAREIYLSGPHARTILVPSLAKAADEMHWPLAELIRLVRLHVRDSDEETWRIQALDRAIEAAGRGDA